MKNEITQRNQFFFQNGIKFPTEKHRNKYKKQRNMMTTFKKMTNAKVILINWETIQTPKQSIET